MTYFKQVKATNSQGLNGNGNGLSPTPDSKQQQTAPIIVVNPLYETGKVLFKYRQ